MLLVCESRSSDFFRHWTTRTTRTTAYNCCVAARWNPLQPDAYSVFRSGGSWRFDPGPFGDEALLGLGSDTRIPNPNGIGWPHSSGMFQGQYLAESYVWHHSEFHRLKMSCNAMFGMFGGSIPNLAPFAEVLLHALLGCLAGLHDARAEWHLCRSTS